MHDILSSPIETFNIHFTLSYPTPFPASLHNFRVHCNSMTDDACATNSSLFELCVTTNCCFDLSLTKLSFNINSSSLIEYLFGRHCSQLEVLNASKSSFLFALYHISCAIAPCKYSSRRIPATHSELFGICMKSAK